jgi:hypothetical protein
MFPPLGFIQKFGERRQEPGFDVNTASARWLPASARQSFELQSDFANLLKKRKISSREENIRRAGAKCLDGFYGQ